LVAGGTGAWLCLYFSAYPLPYIVAGWRLDSWLYAAPYPGGVNAAYIKVVCQAGDRLAWLWIKNNLIYFKNNLLSVYKATILNWLVKQ
jgi:hypothetical protein